jgi:hypothetical protein
MSETSDRAVATKKARELVGAVNLDILLSRATEVRSARRCSRSGDVVGVAAEVQRLGLAIERVQQR